METVSCVELESIAINLSHTVNLLKCFEEFCSNEGLIAGVDIEEEKLIGLVFINRLPQYISLIFSAIDQIEKQKDILMKFVTDLSTQKKVFNNSKNSGVVKLPVVTMSDYKYQENALKDRLEHPERYEKTENVPETIAQLKKWLEEHKTEAGESVKC